MLSQTNFGHREEPPQVALSERSPVAQCPFGAGSEGCQPASVHRVRPCQLDESAVVARPPHRLHR
eukprot:8841929-Alexandrium_andersonii.AAC.1